jgi:hypothetical protein
VFIYRYLISGLIEPVLFMLLKYIQYACISNIDCTSELPAESEQSSGEQPSSAASIISFAQSSTTDFTCGRWSMLMLMMTRY